MNNTIRKCKTGMIRAALFISCIFLLSTAVQADTKVVIVPMVSSGGGKTPAPVAKTGQTVMHGTYDDGHLQKGAAVEPASARFTNNTDGTITDTLTGLIWLTNGKCIHFRQNDLSTFPQRNWIGAIVAANGLGAGYCGLNDGSKPGDWRLPNVRELASLIDYGKSNPALPENSFRSIDIVNDLYWSSTTYSPGTTMAWAVSFYNGVVLAETKTLLKYVRPVRGGR
ncbi:MAG: DUF1566 domain-containing protein [Desulfopila sp.]|jgi:hypothetical protein|nr:DUF1566 domain-containing protein [Desulfopila sp.]